MRNVTPTRLSVRLPAAALGALLLLHSVPLRAQAEFKESLPEHTLFYLAAPNLDAWWTGFKTSPVYKIWVEEEVQEFLADLMVQAEKYKEQYLGMAKAMHQQGRIPIDPEKLLQIRVKGVSLAITDLVIPGGQQPPMVSAVGCIDFGVSASIVREALGVLTQIGMQQAGDKVQLETRDIAGSSFHILPGPPEARQMLPTLGLAWGFVGSRLLFGTDTQRIAQIAAGMSGKKPEKGLPDNGLYRRIAHRISAGRSDMEVYLRPDAFLDAMVGALRFGAQKDPQMSEKLDVDGIARVVDALGLTGMKGLGFSSGYQDGKGFFKAFMACPEDERKGLTTLVADRPVDKEHLGWIPKDVGSFTVFNLGNLEGLYSTVMEALSAYDEGVGQLAHGKLKEFEQQHEMNIKKDIFGAFGPEIITYSMPVTGLMATPEMVIMAECKNTDRTLEVLKQLCELSGGVVSINESNTEEGKYYTIDIVLDDMGMGMDPTGMLDPTFAFKNGFFVFGMSRSDVKGALKRFDGKGEDVRSNPAFKEYLGRIPEKIESLSFTDVASTVDGVYGTLSGVLGMVPIPPDVPVDLGLLPSVDTLTKHLFGSVSWSTRHQDGFASENVGPFGPEMVVALGGAVAVGAVALGWTMAKRTEARVRRVGREGGRR